MALPQATASAASSPPLAWATNSTSIDAVLPNYGLALMLLLVLAATWAWRWRWQRSGLRGRAPNANTDPLIASAIRIDANTRLYVVHWHGNALLLCVSAQAAPVVLARHADGSRASSNAV